jgi:hypothetical protein
MLGLIKSSSCERNVEEELNVIFTVSNVGNKQEKLLENEGDSRQAPPRNNPSIYGHPI